MVGSTLSITVTNWVQLAILPAASVTVHVTIVLPNGKANGALLVNELMLQLS